MNTHVEKTQENQSQSAANEFSHKQVGNDNESSFKFVNNRPEAVAQRKLQAATSQNICP